jgi:hypothetical protein
LGSLLFFDPTDPYVRLGYLPAELQANYGLLVAGSGGELVKLPLLAAPANSLHRIAKLQLTVDGTLQGEAQEARRGAPASDLRSEWLNMSESERRKTVQAFFGGRTGVELRDIWVKDLDKQDADPVLGYNFRLIRYATSAGGLLLLRPPVLSEWGDTVMEAGERKQPVEFPAATQRTETIEITLPDGYTVDELPRPVQVDLGIVSYSSKTGLRGKVLQYTRQLQIKDVLATSEQLAELKAFFRQVAADEKATAVLMKQ